MTQAQPTEPLVFISYLIHVFLFLIGEKLDMKNVETLEEIFKFVQFQCVDLEGTHLDEEVMNFYIREHFFQLFN